MLINAVMVAVSVVGFARSERLPGRFPPVVFTFPAVWVGGHGGGLGRGFAQAGSVVCGLTHRRLLPQNVNDQRLRGIHPFLSGANDPSGPGEPAAAGLPGSCHTALGRGLSLSESDS